MEDFEDTNGNSVNNSPADDSWLRDEIDSDDESTQKADYSASTLEAAAAAKAAIEKFYKNFFHSVYDREQRYANITQQAKLPC